MNYPLKQSLEQSFEHIEKFVILLHDRTSTLTSVNKCRKVMSATKGRSLEAIPPTKDALLQHTKRAAYQAGCWSQSEQRAM